MTAVFNASANIAAIAGGEGGRITPLIFAWAVLRSDRSADSIAIAVLGSSRHGPLLAEFFGMKLYPALLATKSMGW